MMISALVAIDAPMQIGWPKKGAARNGATEEVVKAGKKIAEMCVERIKGNRMYGGLWGAGDSDII
jgi:hypothetical protein